MGYDPVELATRVVSSGLSVSAWCGEQGGGIGKTSVYRALNWCRVNRPSVFGEGEAEAVASGGCHGWYERVLRAMRGEALAPVARDAAEAPSGSFVRLAPERAQGPVASQTIAAAQAIVVEVGCARVSLPSGFLSTDAEAAIAATARALGVVS